MNQWLNRSHPQTLQAAVILGYISALFGLLFLGGLGLGFIIFIGLGVGAFATANNKRWGFILLAVCACLAAAFRILGVVNALDNGVITILRNLNATVFPTALAAAVLHRQSREYQQIWFE